MRIDFELISFIFLEKKKEYLIGYDGMTFPSVYFAEILVLVSDASKWVRKSSEALNF